MSAVALPATSAAARPGALAQLARIEIGRYLRHPLYWLGVVFLLLGTVAPARHASTDASPLSAPIAAAFTLGIIGLVIAAQLARSSDQVGTSAGATPVPERTRTLALACSFVVPVVTAAIWVVAFVALYAGRTAPYAWWFGRLSTVHVVSVLVGTSVVAAFGGPALGLLLARWVRWPAAPLLVAVLLIVVEALGQGGAGSPDRLRLVLPWTMWAAGVTGGEARYLGGNPLPWVGYAVALCVLAVLAAMRHDQDAPRLPLRVAAGLVALVGVVALVLSMTTGVTHSRSITVPEHARAAAR